MTNLKIIQFMNIENALQKPTIQDISEQEQVTKSVSMCEICLDLKKASVRVTNRLNYMNPSTNICKDCLKRLLEKLDKQ